MKEESNYQNYLQLPKRNRSDNSFKNNADVREKNFPSNYFKIEFFPDQKNKKEKTDNLSIIYEYQCQLTHSGVEI